MGPPLLVMTSPIPSLSRLVLITELIGSMCFALCAYNMVPFSDPRFQVSLASLLPIAICPVSRPLRFNYAGILSDR